MKTENREIEFCKECNCEIDEPHFFYDNYCKECGDVEYKDKVAEEKWEVRNGR